MTQYEKLLGGYRGNLVSMRNLNSLGVRWWTLYEIQPLGEGEGRTNAMERERTTDNCYNIKNK